MKCPKHPGMRLHWSIHTKYPELKKYHQSKIHVEEIEPNSRPLIEPPLEYDENDAADMVIKNANLFQEDGSSTGQAIAISKNIITKVGPWETIEPLVTESTRIYDAGGASVLPGFTDSHLHLLPAMERLRACDVEPVKTADEFKEQVAAFAEANRDRPVLYVFGLHYFDPPIIPSETCRAFLDQIVPDRPLMVFAHDLHTAWGNTRALEVAEILHPMPPFPVLIEELDFDRNIILGADGIPSGELREPEVYFLVSGPLAKTFPKTMEENLDDLKQVCRELARHGLTSIHRMALAQPAEDISLLLWLLELDQRGELPIRVSTSYSAVADTNMLEDVYQASQIRDAFAMARRGKITAAELHDYLVGCLQRVGRERHEAIEELQREKREIQDHPHIHKILHRMKHIHHVIDQVCIQPHVQRANPHQDETLPTHIKQDCKIRCDTIKVFMDGVIEKDTAYRLDQTPGAGIPEFNQEEIVAMVELADRLGMQVAAHSIGDASVRSVLDAIASAREKHDEIDQARTHSIRHRIEHIEICRPEDLPRFVDRSVIASMQPLHEHDPPTLWHELVPKDQWDTAFAWKTLVEEGTAIVYGSDWPIVSCDVRVGIHRAVTRTPWLEGEPDQSLTLAQALGAYTSNAAFTEYSEKVKGKIQPGR
ncbi:MAG: amidohydrolase, partial [Planctomycetia bacterium]